MKTNRRKAPRPLTDHECQLVQTFLMENAGFLHYIYLMFSSDRAAESDVIQECFVRIMSNIDTFLSMSPQRQRAYTVPIIEHLCIDRARREKRAVTVPLSDEIASEKTQPGSDAHLSVLLLSKKLPEKDWNLLKGLYIDGQSKQELAKALHCSEDSLRMMASRARKAARAILEQQSVERISESGDTKEEEASDRLPRPHDEGSEKH